MTANKANAGAPRRTVTTEITPAFCDVDPMGVVWHGNYFRYLEVARTAFLDSFDYGYIKMEESGYVWPIVEARMKYIVPVFFGQRIRVVTTLVEYENRLRLDYEIFEAVSGTRTTKAQTTQIAVRKATREMCFASPAILFEKLGLPPP
ncbi:MAG: acyl-CoA thioesterase [Puniceicoccales bacterium]|jgi:acyl-CoA thioester hydrolase|nr:acyl-CoA thioesterase [Puniceicoccales bacterium]